MQLEREYEMNYEEVRGNLFDAPDNCLLVHCISADFALGAGIAKTFTEMDVKRQLMERYEKNKWDGKGYCLITGSIHNGKDSWNVANLVTKPVYYSKPTYDTLQQSLEALKKYCEANDITDLAMPAIGCGLDRLEWEKVSNMIKAVFEDIDVNITVYMR